MGRSDSLVIMRAPPFFTLLHWFSWPSSNLVIGMKPSQVYNCCTDQDVLRVGTIAYNFEPIMSFEGNVSTGKGEVPHFTGFVPEILPILCNDLGLRCEIQLVPCLPDNNFNRCMREQIAKG